MTWLPAFARTIRRVEIEGSAPVHVDCVFAPLLNERAIHIVSLSGSNRERHYASIFPGDTVSCSALTLRVPAHSPAV